jgi:hypothetical protein
VYFDLPRSVPAPPFTFALLIEWFRLFQVLIDDLLHVSPTTDRKAGWAGFDGVVINMQFHDYLVGNP